MRGINSTERLGRGERHKKRLGEATPPLHVHSRCHLFCRAISCTLMTIQKGTASSLSHSRKGEHSEMLINSFFKIILASTECVDANQIHEILKLVMVQAMGPPCRKHHSQNVLSESQNPQRRRPLCLAPAIET